MSTSTLMDRAKAVLQRRTAAAALVIVPLAIAVPGRADSVQFSTLGPNTITGQGFTGGLYGHASSSGDSSSVKLTGDTIQPDSGTYLTAGNADQSNGVIVFDWNGNFASPPLSLAQLSLSFQNSSSYVGSDTEDLAWTLTVNLFDPIGDTIATNSTAGTGFGNATGSFDTFVSALEPDSWEANLTVTWKYPATVVDIFNNLGAINPTDQLNFSPSATLTLSGSSGNTPPPIAPLPATVWSGGSLLMFMGVLKCWKGTRRREEGTTFTL